MGVELRLDTLHVVVSPLSAVCELQPFGFYISLLDGRFRLSGLR